MKILEIGCGENPNPNSTIRMDIRNLPTVDIVGDGKYLSSIPSESLDGIFARHVLEHFSIHEIDSVLTEWARVIKSGGFIEIHCPDMEKIFKNYLNRSIDYYTGRTFDAQLLSYYLYGGQEHEFNYHKSGFTYESICKLLADKGFVEFRHMPGEDHLEFRVKAWKK